MKDENSVALSVRAVTCDALARGEQIFHLLAGAGTELARFEHLEFWLRPDWTPRPLQDLTEPYQDRTRALDDLRREDGRTRLKYYATVEYVEALVSAADLRGLDGDHTLSFEAVEELFRRTARRPSGGEVSGGTSAEPGAGPLRGPEGAGPDPGGTSTGGPGAPVALLVTRVFERPEPTVLRDGTLRPLPRTGAKGGQPFPDTRDLWLRLPEPLTTAGLEPVVEDDRFLSLKARLLQRTGAIREI